MKQVKRQINNPIQHTMQRQDSPTVNVFGNVRKLVIKNRKNEPGNPKKESKFFEIFSSLLRFLFL